MPDDMDRVLAQNFGDDDAGGEAGGRQDGLLFSDNKSQKGVLQRLAQVSKTEDYRQQLLLGDFESREDATRVVAAIDERTRYGVDIGPVVDLVAAWSAVRGAQGGRVHSLITGVTRREVGVYGDMKDRIKDKVGKKQEQL